MVFLKLKHKSFVSLSYYYNEPSRPEDGPCNETKTSSSRHSVYFFRLGLTLKTTIGALQKYQF